MDPGINTGYAIIDLGGRLVSAGVEKEANHEDIVRIISTIGKPTIIATDVQNPPEFVVKVAACFNVRVFRPMKNITQDEKREIGEDILDPHIRDAYAAAIKAYRNHANRLRQIDAMKPDPNDHIKSRVISGIPVCASGNATVRRGQSKKRGHGKKQIKGNRMNSKNYSKKKRN